jgi:hypothetical protein
LVTDRPASGAALWRLNVAGLLREALERSPGGIIRQPIATELVTAWFEQHPEERKAPNARRWERERKRKSEANERLANADVREIAASMPIRVRRRSPT